MVFLQSSEAGTGQPDRLYVMLHEFKDHKWIKRILLIGVAMLIPHVCGTGTGHDRGVEWIQKKGTLKFAQGGFAAGCAADAVF